MIMLLAPQDKIAGLQGMELLQTAMFHHFGHAGVVFTAVTLWLFSFSTFIGILYYARSNVAYLFSDNRHTQTAYKILALVMLFIGGLAAYTFVWDLGDIGIGLMTVFNMIAILPMGNQAMKALDEYMAAKNNAHNRNRHRKKAVPAFIICIICGLKRAVLEQTCIFSGMCYNKENSGNEVA